MSHSLFRFAFGSVLLAGCSIAWGQGSSDRAYPMNVEDRINGVTSSGDYITTIDEDRPLTAQQLETFSAIASPMMERLGYAERDEYVVNY